MLLLIRVCFGVSNLHYAINERAREPITTVVTDEPIEFEE